MRKKEKEKEWLEEPEEFVQAMLGIGEETYYNYRCSHCNYEEQVADFVVDELAAFNELPPGVMPELKCSNCCGILKCID